MTISGVLWRYVATFGILTAALAVVGAMLDLRSNSGFGIAILIASVIWPCLAFGEKNKRDFSDEEKRTVTWSMIGINIVLESLIGAVALLFLGKFELGIFLGVMLFVGVLHALVIFFMVRSAGKMVEKQ